MKAENNWNQKTLESLEKDIWPALSPNEDSYLIKTCHSLRKKPLGDFTTEDLRIMIGQNIGLYFLIPRSIEILRGNLFAEGDLFEGDLLNSVLNVDPGFWTVNNNYWQQVNELIKDRRDELAEMKFDLSRFDVS